MTDNSNFKNDATELLKRLISFQRVYGAAIYDRKENGFKAAEIELRKMLFIARTDEENNTQREKDMQC